MRQSELFVGTEYAYGVGRYGGRKKARLLRKGVPVPYMHYKGVEVEFENGTITAIPAKHLHELWATYHAREEERRIRRQEVEAARQAQHRELEDLGNRLRGVANVRVVQNLFQTHVQIDRENLRALVEWVEAHQGEPAGAP